MKTHLTLIVVLFLALMPAPILPRGSSLSKDTSGKVLSTSPTEATRHREENVNESHLTAAYSKLPLSFEINQGQTDAQVKFLARSNGYQLYLTSSEAVLSMSKPLKRSSAQEDVLRMKLVAANPSPFIEGLEQLPGKSNYLIGNDSKRWHRDVAHYAKVRYQAVYPGVDMIYYGNQQQLEYDFIVAPGTDPSVIRLAFDDARRVKIDSEGDLLLRTSGGELRQRKPVVYQEIDGEKREVSCRYVKHAKDQVGFEVGDYDPQRMLVIDPVLVYSTYLGGTGNDSGNAIAVDSLGNVYVTGTTSSSQFPTTPNTLSPVVKGGNTDAFVTKIDASGSFLIYSTYFGGGGIGTGDVGNGVVVDSAGNAYVTGGTTANDFPTTPGAFDTVLSGGGDAFIAKLNSTGASLLYSTYLGSSNDGAAGMRGEGAYGIAIDSAGNAYITGETPADGFPITAGAFDTSFNGGSDAFITKLNSAGSALVYSTYLGGGTSSGTQDVSYAIVVDAAGNAYVTGETRSTNFPKTNPFDNTLNGGIDGFVTKLNAAGSALVYSTYLGGNGNGDRGASIAVDSAGNSYVAGQTNSPNFPTTSGSFDVSLNGNGSLDAFVTKFNSSGSALIYSTYLGGTNSGGDVANGIVIDTSGNAYVTGETFSTNFPTTPDAFDSSHNGNSDAFVTELNAAGSTLLYSTFLGGANTDRGRGIAVDGNGNMYATGETSSTNFPTVSTAFDLVSNGLNDAFIVRIGEPGSTPCPPIDLIPQAAPAGTVGVSYSLVFSPTGGSAPFTFAASGNLPPGLSLVPQSGQLAGTPASAGTFNFTITTTDVNGCTGARSYELVMSCPVITLAPSALPAGTEGTPYNQLITATGGAAPYSFMTSGGLPPGISLSNAGQLAGTPTAFGSFTFTVTAVDAFSCSGAASYTLTINPAPTPTPTPTPTPSPQVTNGKIAFETNRDGNTELYLMNMDGSNPTRLTTDNSRDSDPFFSPDGLRIVFSTARNGNSELYVMNVNGTAQTRLTFNTVDDFRPAFSPDGSKIAFYRNSGNSSEIFVMNADGTNEVRLTNNSAADEFPKWSPDGTRIIFQSNRDGDYEVYTMDLAGLNVVQLTNNTFTDREASFSPDGSKIVFFSDRAGGGSEVFVMNANGSNPVNVSNSVTNDGSCSWSADGKKILFISSRDGNTEVYVMNADGTGQTRLTFNTNFENTPMSQPIRQ